MGGGKMGVENGEKWWAVDWGGGVGWGREYSSWLQWVIDSVVVWSKLKDVV